MHRHRRAAHSQSAEGHPDVHYLVRVNPTYVSVDIETAGPSPSIYSLLAIGACVVADPTQTFYVELQPDRTGVDEGALAVSGLSLDRLAIDGVPAEAAMRSFADWADRIAKGSRPVLVALNAPFDWMFVADYFHRYVGRNPFGHSAIDMKAVYMGATGVPWEETSLNHMSARYDMTAALPHHALQDAVIQAAVFRRILEDLNR
jgi:ribonuclease T